MKLRLLFTWVLLFSSLLSPSLNAASKVSKEYLVFVGTYTEGKSKGIYSFKMDAASGKLSPLGLAAETSSPSFLAIHPNKKFLYAVNEVAKFEGKPAGAVSAFEIEGATGKLKALNQQTSGGPGPCHVFVDRSGKNVLVANYSGGSFEVLPLNSDGSLKTPSAFVQHPKEAKEPRGHFVETDPANKFALVADLGLDKVMIYKFDAANGSVTPNDPPFAELAKGAGPRHFTFTPNGKRVYVIGELNMTVTGFNYDASKGALTKFQTVSTLPEGATGKGFSTAEIFAHPNGKFVYGSNRGHDTIAVFSVDQKTGNLTLIQNAPSGGKIPRNFNIEPGGKFLIAANQDSENIVTFKIDQKTGKLTPTGESFEVGKPVCVEFLPL